MPKLVATSILACLLFASSSASAAPITFELTLTQTSPSADIIVGTFSIDDSLLVANSFVAASLWSSFDITVAGVAWTLSDKFSPGAEGVLTDAAGEPFRFNDSVGDLTEFCPGGIGGNCPGNFLRFTDGTNTYDTAGGDPERTAGTYAIARQDVPEPATLALLTLAIGASAFRRRSA